MPLDPAMAALMEELNPTILEDNILKMNVWQTIMRIFDRYERYFCAIYNSFLSPTPDHNPWRTFTALLQFNEETFHFWAAQEFTGFRDWSEVFSSSIGVAFVKLCGVINRFHGLMVCQIFY